MKNQLLISRKWLLPATVLFILGAFMGLFSVYDNWQIQWLDAPDWQMFSGQGAFDLGDNNFTNEIAFSFVIIGLLALCFTQVEDEDEFVYQNRLLSWQWSILVNYSILFIANWVIYGTGFLDVMLFSMVSIPLIFLIRFYFILYNLRHHEE